MALIYILFPAASFRYYYHEMFYYKHTPRGTLMSVYIQYVIFVCSELRGEGRGRTGGVRNLCLYLLSLLEPSGGDGVALLVLQQLLGRLEELVANVALKHSCDEVDLEVALVHAARLAHKIAEDALKTWRESKRRRRKVSIKTGFVFL